MVGVLRGVFLVAILYLQTTPQSSSSNQSYSNAKQHNRRRLGRRLKGNVSRKVCPRVSDEGCSTCGWI
jgi:hypothetical protein